jgi:acyl carrier protein
VAATPEVLGAVVAALGRVLECEVSSVTPETALADLGVDSLVRVEVAELVEQALEGRVRISDERLDEAPTVAALAAGFVISTAGNTRTTFTSTGGDG